MSAGIATQRREAPATRSRTLADRFYAALPLLSVFLWLCVLYGWESWSHRTPWLFGDELQWAQISRSLAETGHSARRGVPYSFHSLYTFLIAPAWWLHGVDRSYAVAKYIGVVAMTLTIFPAYFLARTIASPRASLFAAIATTTIPAFVYTSFLIEEPAAYCWATLSLLLILRTLLTPTQRWLVPAVAVTAVAPLWKGELVVLPAVFALAAALMWWSGEWARDWRSGWSRGDWAGAIVLIAGLVFFLSALAQWRSAEYLEVTRGWKTRVLDHSVKAGGALTVGIGILPTLVAGGTLFRAPGEGPSHRLRAFRSVLAASIFLFGLYAGIKGAYNQNHFATRIWERNAIYLAPLFFAAVALWLDRRRLSLIGLAIGAGYVAYVLAKLPFRMVNDRFASDTPGMTILSEANRRLALTSSGAQLVLFLIFAAGLVVLLVPQLRALSRRIGLALAAFVAVFLLAWTLAGELSASTASNSISRTFRANIRGNPSWVDRYTGGKPALYIAQTEQILPDQNSAWLLEFWNRSIKQIWIIGSCICGPGPTTTPDIMNAEGLIYPQPGYPYVVVEPGIVPDGTYVARHSHRGGGGLPFWRLYRVHQPLRLKAVTTGLYFDRWSQEPGGSAYTRFDHGVGTLRIQITRSLWGGPSHPYAATVKIGTIAIDHRQPVMGRVFETRRVEIRNNQDVLTIPLRMSRTRYRVEVSIDPPLVPAEEAPQSSSDRRQLGAVVSYRFFPRKAAQR